ncbi:MAG TPA: hypothetical protein VIJ71_07280 [Mycobacteriales bacterium]
MWLIICSPDDAVLWVEADRLRTATPHLELVIDIVFLGRPRAVVERRLVAQQVLVFEPVDHMVLWRPHHWRARPTSSRAGVALWSYSTVPVG